MAEPSSARAITFDTLTYILTIGITISHIRDTGDIENTQEHKVYTSIKQNIKTTCLELVDQSSAA